MMKKQSHITGFYLETLMLIVVFVLIILVLTQVFGLAQMQSTRARQLNGAVILAQNALEAVSASETPEELLKLLNDNDNAVLMADTAGVTACYDRDLNPDAEGNYRVDVTWLPEETENGILVHSVAEVRCDDAEAPVYRLETERFRTGVSA
jgi:Tfp pilus assembly protein PilV